jgi:hypothetical protein
MSLHELLRAHRYADAIALSQRRITNDPDDWEAVGTLASALRATGAHDEALPLFERIGVHERRRVSGSPGRQNDISCLRWCMGDQRQGITFMRGLVSGVLDGSVQYGDQPGGVQQGLLLYYMGITAKDEEAAAFAIDYLRNRTRNTLKIKYWPGPLARYYLGEVEFPDVLAAATGERGLTEAVSAARNNLMNRRRLCGALFHDGVWRRAQGAEELCLARMRACYALEDPLIELEWYLAPYEVERANGTES